MSTRLHRFFVIASLLGSTAAMAGPDHVVPYAGVIDKNGAPFTGPVSLNFGLFNCPNGVCPTTPLWVASGAQTSFPPAGANGVNVTSSGGQFSVLLGDTGQVALPDSVQQSTQLHVRIAIKAANGDWIPLGGAQRVAPVARAISAEEANSFTVRQDLTVARNATVQGNLTVNGTLTNPGGLSTTGSVTGATVTGTTVNATNLTATNITANSSLRSNGSADIDGTFNADGAVTVGSTLTLAGVSSKLVLNDRQLLMRAGNDLNHGVRFDGGVDGPTLWGNSGGALATGVPGAQRLVLRWFNNGNVTVENVLNAGGYQKNGNPLFIICTANRNERHDGSVGHSITFTAAECGNPGDLLFSGNYVGILGQMSICNNNNDFHSVVVRPGTQNVNAPDVLWRGTACGQGTYNVSVVYLRK